MNKLKENIVDYFQSWIYTLIVLALLGIDLLSHFILEEQLGYNMSRDIEYIDNKHRIIDNHEFCIPQWKGRFFWHNYKYDTSTGKFVRRFLFKKDALSWLLKDIHGDFKSGNNSADG